MHSLFRGTIVRIINLWQIYASIQINWLSRWGRSDIPWILLVKKKLSEFFHKSGYFSNFGPEVCFRSHMVMLHLVFFSLFLIAYSFWYRYDSYSLSTEKSFSRYTVLVKEPPSGLVVQMFAVVMFIPNAISTVWLFFNGKCGKPGVVANFLLRQRRSRAELFNSSLNIPNDGCQFVFAQYFTSYSF